MNADALDIRLLRFRSKRDEAPHSLAAALLEADRVGEALEVVHAGLLDAEDDPTLLVLEGRAWFAEGDLPQAQAALLRAAKLQPTHVEAYRWLSQVLMKRGEPDKAVRVLERAAKLRPDDGGIASALARARRLSRIAEQADSGRLEQPSAPGASGPVPRDPEPGPATRPAPPKAAAPPPPSPEALAPPKPAGPPPGPEAYVPPRPSSPGPPRTRGAEQPSPSASSLPSPSDDSLVHALVDSTEYAVEEEPGAALPDEGTDRHLPRFFDDDEDKPTTAMAVPDDDEFDRPTAAVAAPGASAPARAPDEAGPTNAYPPEASPSEMTRSANSSPPPAAHSFTAPEPGLEPPEPSLPLADEDADRGADDSFEPAFVAGAEPREPVQDGGPGDAAAEPGHASVEPAGSQPTGDARPGEADAPERVLEVVADQGLFERESAEPEGDWVPQGEARGEGTRTRTGLMVGWLLALLLAGGGYFGWQKWVEHRHREAAEIVAAVQQALIDGERAARAQAEAELGRARQLDPRAEGLDRAAVLLQSMHALEDGELDVGYLRPALARFEESSEGSVLGQLATGIIGLSSGSVHQAQSALEAVDGAQPGAQELYLAAALASRLGQADAVERFEQAAVAQGTPRALFLQGAAHHAVRGDVDGALGWLERAGEAGAQGLRAKLWQAVLAPAAGEGLEAQAQKLERAAAADRLLFHLAAARQAFAQGDAERATAEVREARALPVRDPQLLALLARVASRVGAHDAAYGAARGALQTVPQNAAYRDAMVQALLARGDGEAVERALSDAPADAAWVVVARARSALLTGSEEALRAAAEKLPSLTEQEADPELEALRLRVELRLGRPPRALLGRARKLAHVAGDRGRVQLALGETALAAGDAKVAVEALEKARAQLADSGELLEQLARAYRNNGQPKRAREAFQRALEVAPELTAAKAELARIALAEGDWEAAEQGFAQIQRGEHVAAAKLGHIEALTRLGRLLDARDELAGLPREVREGTEGQRLLAILQLANGDLREAEDTAEDLVHGAGRSAANLTLYGDILFADDEVDEAAGAYDAALEEDGGYPDALVGRARAAVRAEKTRQAYRWLDAAEKSLETRARPPRVRAELLTARGMALIQDREFEKARAALAEAVTLQGVPVEAYFWLGEAQALTKDAGARESYERYLELAPRGDLAGRARRALKPR